MIKKTDGTVKPSLARFSWKQEHLWSFSAMMNSFYQRISRTSTCLSVYRMWTLEKKFISFQSRAGLEATSWGFVSLVIFSKACLGSVKLWRGKKKLLVAKTVDCVFDIIQFVMSKCKYLSSLANSWNNFYNKMNFIYISQNILYMFYTLLFFIHS